MADNRWFKVPAALMSDASLSANAKLTYIALARYANTRRQAWPSLATLAADAGISSSSVKRGRDELKAAGWVTWKPRATSSGMKASTLYTLSVPDGPQRTIDGSDRPIDGSQGTSGWSTQTLSMGQGEPGTRSKELDPMNRRASRAVDVDDRFDEFWKVYPRHDKRSPSKTAWAKALKTADADTIIAGALRYAEHRATEIAAGRSGPQYTALATTWLNEERWTDEPDTQVAEVITPGLAAWSNNITDQRMRGEIA